VSAISVQTDPSARMLTLNRAIVSAVVFEKLTEVTRRHPEAPLPRVLLIWGSYSPAAAPEFAVKLGGEAPRVQVRVRDEHSVLGVVDAVQQQVASNDGELLVITTGLDLDLGWDVLGHAYGQDVHAVDPAQVIGQRFQAVEVDPRLQQQQWLISALLDAEPPEGWPPAGAALSLDAAISALVAQRLNLVAARTDSLDVVALLEWSASPSAPDRYTELANAERAQIRDWLCSRVGAGAEAVLSLVERGQAEDLLSLGLLCAVSEDPAAGVPLALLLGDVVRRPGELPALWSVVNGLATRWVAEIESRPEAPGSLELRRRLERLVTRADQLADQHGLVQFLTRHRWLLSAWGNDFRELGRALDAALTGSSESALADTSLALKQVENHGLARLYPQRRDAARDAVRLTRWLADPVDPVRSIADAIQRHSNDWGWVDRALNVLWSPETGGDPVVSAAYGRVYQEARRRRDEIDLQAATQLATWAAYAASPNTEGALVVEDVLARIAVPLSAGTRPPLVVVLDGMSSAVAIELAEQAAREGWFEASPQGARLGAVSVLPSVTRLSRTSLLTGVLGQGDQRTERDGFAALWRLRHQTAQLFHKGDLAGGPGHRFSESVRAALEGDDVVGVVLNTIDDALDHGREGLRTGWSVRDVTYLVDLLNAAREGARPVLLVADHGHVLERSSQDDPSTRDEGDTSARWRTGADARDGEIEVAGPRVLEGGGRVVLPWRESIRYSRRRAGYHGGASLAEITVPIIVLLPSREQLPPGWQVLSPEAVTPIWWTTRQAVTETSVPVEAPRAAKPVKQSGRASSRPVGPPQDALFGVDDAGSTAADAASVSVPAIRSTVGHAVVASKQYALTRSLVRKPPAPAEVAAVIDALISADGTMSLSAVAAAASRAGRNPEGLLSTLQRLLNVEGYPVLSQVDGGLNVRLDLPLLREQFELGT
jgi:hypothetical protein